ncbi:MAG: class B sortase, partial [Lachnospiraceae bacterium]|nr:class B sortase [Lachnospiraceae bacterium]
RGRRQFLEIYRVELTEWAPPVSVAFLVVLIFLTAMLQYRMGYMGSAYAATRDNLTEALQNVSPTVINDVASTASDPAEDTDQAEAVPLQTADMTQMMEEVHGINPDTAGWLSIDGTVIDYPVMQTPSDEQYYLNRDFDGKYSAYGCIIADTDSVIGTGTKANNYDDGSIPSTNIILHGHNMKNGTMFGGLDKYRDQTYEKSHSRIKFSSLYEEREYEICAVFLSQVYKKSDDVFKYYQFFNADTEEEFNDFYKNIKSMSMYDTGVDAAYGDEFLTLSVCAYHVDNGRLVVVAKRIR